MAEPLFTEEEVLHLADQLRDFQSSPAREALEFIAGRLLQQNIEVNLVETERCRNWFRGYKTGCGAELTGADTIIEAARRIRAREAQEPEHNKT